LKYLLIILLIVFWSTVASVFKLVLREINFIEMLMWSSMFSAAGLLAANVLLKNLRELFTVKPGRLIKYALIGLINPFLYYNILFKSYSLLPAQEAQPLNYTWPVVLTLFTGIFLKEKLTRYNFIGLIIAFSGVMIIFTNGNPLAFRFTNLTGDILATGSSIIWASYWIISIKDSLPASVKLFFIFLFGSIYITVQALITGNMSLPSPGIIAGCAYIGLFEMGITFLIWLTILQQFKVKSRIIVITYIIPFISLFFIHIIVGETIRMYSILGLTLIVGGIIINSIKKRRSIYEKDGNSGTGFKQNGDSN